MIRNNRKINAPICLALVLTLLFSLCACGPIVTPSSLLNSDSVTAYLSDTEGIPDFNVSLFGTVEICFNKHYYMDLEDSQTLGKKTVDAYEEFCRGKVDETSTDEVTYALIDCFIYAVGDKYAYYRTKEEAEDYTTDMSGSFVGIGVSVTYNVLENTILVMGVELDSPADRAGIRADDYIVAVDGELVTQLGVTTAINNIKGTAGTSVKITILRGDEEIELDIVREKITETTVRHEIIDGGKVGYIKITSFKGNTFSQFKESVDALEAAGVESIIFDLRSNSGGYLTAVTSMLSYLVPDGTKIASFSNGKDDEIASSGHSREEVDHVLTLPSVVLCNSESASAAELFTGAMRDYNDMGILESTVMGELTYKKGIMQSSIDFVDGSTLTLTTALYNPPSGVNFHGVGVSPDIPLDEDADYIKAALDYLNGN